MSRINKIRSIFNLLRFLQPNWFTENTIYEFQHKQIGKQDIFTSNTHDKKQEINISNQHILAKIEEKRKHTRPRKVLYDLFGF